MKLRFIYIGTFIVSIFVNAMEHNQLRSTNQSIFNSNLVDLVEMVEPEIIKIVEHEVTATKYNAVVAQCDDDPLITADCSKINLTKLNNYELRWIAISRDLKEFYNFGDVVTIECENPALCGEWEVHDVMNKRFTKKIDFLVPINDNYNFNKPIKVKISKQI